MTEMKDIPQEEEMCKEEMEKAQGGASANESSAISSFAEKDQSELEKPDLKSSSSFGRI